MGSPYRVPAPPREEPPGPNDFDAIVVVVLVGLVGWLLFSVIRPHPPRGYDSAGGTHISHVQAKHGAP